MTETPNKKGFFENLDQTIQDTQAKTVDFFDNAFGGDKRTLEEIKENRQRIRDEGIAKRKEIDSKLKKTKTSKVLRGTISGPLKAINETVEFVDDIYDYAAGNPYDNNEIIDLKALGLEVQGDKEDWAYTLPQAVSQFLLPQGLIGKGLKATKLAGMNNAWTRNALAGFITDAVVQDPFEENLFNMIDKHPGLASPISELLKSKTEDEISVAEARLRQAGGGFIAGEALTVLGLGIKGIKKVPDVYERITKRLSRRDEILMTDDVVDNLGDEIIDLDGVGQFKKQLKDGRDTLPPRSEDGDFIDPEGFFDIQTDEQFDDFFKPVERPPVKPFKTNLEAKRGLSRGADNLKKRLRLEVNTKGADPNEVEAIETFIDTIGDRMFDQESLSITTKLSQGGQYNFANNLIKIRKQIVEGVEQGAGGGFGHVMIHELSHGLSRYLPKEDLAKYTKEFKSAQNKYLKKFEKERQTFIRTTSKEKLADLIFERSGSLTNRKPVITDKNFVRKANAYFDQGKFKNENYRFMNIDEYFAENITDEFFDFYRGENRIAGSPLDFAPQGTFKRITQELALFVEDLFVSLKAKLGGSQTRKIFNDYVKRKNVKKYRNVPLDLENVEGVTGMARKKKQKIETTFNTKTNTKGKYYKTETLTGGGNDEAARLIIDRATKLRDLDANNSWPYKRTFGDMVDNANKLLPRETIEAAVRFNARYGRGGEEDLPAILISMNQLMNENAIKLARLSKTMDESLASGNLEGLKNIKADFIKEAEVLDGLILLNKPLKTIPAQTLAANRAAGGVSRVGATIQDLKGRTPTEKAIDQATNLRSVVKEGEDSLPKFSMKEIIDLAEKGDKKSLKQLRIITKRLQAAKGNPAALQKMGKYDAIAKVSSAVLKGQNEIFINSILSGPETHAVNILSTALNSVARPLEQTLGSAVTGDLTGALRGAKELYYLGESISESLKAAKLAFEIEDNIINPGAMIQDSDRFTIRMEGDNLLASMVNLFGTAIRLPSRFLLAEDEFFKSLNFRSYVKATAWEDGVRKGLKGQDLTDHIQKQFDGTIEIVNTNSFKNVKDTQITELYEKAQEYAAETTFTKNLDPDGIGGRVQNIAQHPVGRVFLPFVRTPVNIFKAQARRTPGLNIFIEEYRQALRSPDPSIAAKARGEMVTGAAIWGTATVVAFGQNNPLSELTITGGGPSNLDLLNQKRATGWQPYSFRFLLKDKDGNVRMGKDGKPRYKYVSYKRLDPWSSFLMMAADGAAIMGGLTKQDRDDWAVAASVALGRNITNKTYLQGITELSDLLQKPYKLERWVARRLASTVNPYSALGRSVKKFGLKTPVANEPFGQMIEGDRRIYDKKVRAGDDGMVVLKKFWNELAATVPGYNNNLRPMRNWVTGSFIEYPAGYGSDNMDILNPIKETNSVNNTVLTTLSELGAKVTQPSDTLSLGRLPSGQPIDSGIKLTYDEHLDLIEETAFVKINGVTMVQSLNKIIQTPQFQQLLKQARGEYITQTNMDVSVGASEYARASAEDALRDEINKYKKAGKQVWLNKNPQRKIEYDRANAAMKKQASEDFLSNPLFNITSSSSN
tara:strand:+ start:151 stop:4881 length:4731 start_codon:yes stop_codon:yes gene_type:complete